MVRSVYFCRCKDDIEFLRNCSAFTIEGLRIDQESLDQLFAWIRKYTELKREMVYVTDGRLMNESYGLTGDNAYPADLHIVSIVLDDFENLGALIGPRFEIGARWMDDIIENNLRREA